jgi:hypothetical protein
MLTPTCSRTHALRMCHARQAAERRTLRVNKSLALARRAHAAAAAVAAAAAAEGRPPALADLIVDASWRDALAADLARDSFRSLETVRCAAASAALALGALRAHPPFPAQTAS